MVAALQEVLAIPSGNNRAITLSMQMLYEWPHPQIDLDWEIGAHQWREITPLAYRELQQIPLLCLCLGMENF